ncbi:uncharacterized protein LOC106138292 [Amyelois transitella]|uniref:uncharacterized protein LOC106138292 n=1 Tax=Amyelois transitella TaxID=680683 RepID=UPI00298F75D2|nr:uncharacterized protein LOC106138292 [Amyelois transitella]
MRSRLLFLRKNLGNVLESRRYASKNKDHCDAHMNELPIPCGDFETFYADRQSFYNKILVGGALWFAFSLVMMVYTGSIYLNFFPPAQPGPPSDMITDADDKC